MCFKTIGELSAERPSDVVMIVDWKDSDHWSQNNSVIKVFSWLGFLVLAGTFLNPTVVTGNEPDERSREVFASDVRPFLKKHCYACHDQREARAGFRIDELSDKMFHAGSADQWLEVMDSINLGKMPPDDQTRPEPAESFDVVKWIASELQRAEKAASLAGGRIPMRRLNRDEYANTIRDLLKIDEKLLEPIVEDLPGDGKSEGFDRLGVALFFDQTQIASSLTAAEMISELAIVDPNKMPVVQTTRFEAEQDRAGGMGIRKIRQTERNRFVSESKVEVETGAQIYEIQKNGVMFVQGYDVYQRGNPRGRLATVTVDELIPEDGFYRIRVRCGADPGTRGDPIRMTVSYNIKTPQEHSQEVAITARAEDPEVFETVMFLHRGADDQRRKITLTYNDLRKYIVTTPEASQLRQDTVGTVGKIQAARSAGDSSEVERLEAVLHDARQRAAAWMGPARHINPDFAKDDPPRFYLDWLEFEGPLQQQWPPESHQLIFFDGDDRKDVGYAREIVQRFLPRAYRRPVTASEVERVMKLVESELQSSQELHLALRLGLQRILTSPGFLFLQEPQTQGSLSNKTETPRPLNDYELACRLSYFLWSTMPDDELFQLAEEGRLSDAAVLGGQVDRLLADPKCREFVENFGGQWLSVKEFGSVMPASEYRDYDADLEESSKLEAYALVEEILVNDLPITTFLDSDFVVINERLARHYAIEGVTGEGFRRVDIKPEHHRGGVLGMAGLMTLLSDGTRTLPVRRASWVVTNLFNDPPPPPPPNAGEVQPNTAGEKLTVRERLSRHRDEPTCASCHRTLDPFGLALENYDAIGLWRTRQNGEGFRGRKSPELDVSGTLPSGRQFDGLNEFKAALVEEKDRFARAFSQRMLTYALCRPVGYADRETTDRLVQSLVENEYRIQSLIHAIVASDPFQTK
jgi:hypothetical protein